MQFLISHPASWLRTRCFSEPTFRPSGATNHWKNTVFRDFPTFSRICIFFLLTLSLLIFSLLIFFFSLLLCCSAVHLSILSEVWLLNFLRLCYIHLFYLWNNMMQFQYRIEIAPYQLYHRTTLGGRQGQGRQRRQRHGRDGEHRHKGVGPQWFMWLEPGLLKLEIWILLVGDHTSCGATRDLHQLYIYHWLTGIPWCCMILVPFCTSRCKQPRLSQRA